MGDFLNFNKMITPSIIKILFILGVALSVLSGLFQLFEGGMGVLSGLITIVLGPIFARVYCEILIVLFKINETLQLIHDKMDPSRSEN